MAPLVDQSVINSNSYTLGKHAHLNPGEKSSISPERSEIIAKLISKYSPVLGGNSFDE